MKEMGENLENNFSTYCSKRREASGIARGHNLPNKSRSSSQRSRIIIVIVGEEWLEPEGSQNRRGTFFITARSKQREKSTDLQNLRLLNL